MAKQNRRQSTPVETPTTSGNGRRGRKTLPDEIKNDPRALFEYNANSRVQRAITLIESVGKLYGGRYDFTSEHVDTIEELLTSAVTDAIALLRERPTSAAVVSSRSIFNFE